MLTHGIFVEACVTSSIFGSDTVTFYIYNSMLLVFDLIVI